MSELAPQDAVNRLDTLYNNQKYSELDLGTALQLLALTSAVQWRGLSLRPSSN